MGFFAPPPGEPYHYGGPADDAPDVRHPNELADYDGPEWEGYSHKRGTFDIVCACHPDNDWIRVRFHMEGSTVVIDHGPTCGLDYDWLAEHIDDIANSGPDQSPAEEYHNVW